jgi:hypothetical protein
MSEHAGQIPARAHRPATLTIASVAGLVVGVLGALGAIVGIATGKDAVRDYTQKTLDGTIGSDIPSDLANSAVSSAVDSGYHTLVVKAVVALVLAALIVAAALLVRGGSTPVRVVFSIVLAIGVCGGAGLPLTDADVLPKADLGLYGLMPLLSLVAIVCCWLPAGNRYAKARKRSADQVSSIAI